MIKFLILISVLITSTYAGALKTFTIYETSNDVISNLESDPHSGNSTIFFNIKGYNDRFIVKRSTAFRDLSTARTSDLSLVLSELGLFRDGIYSSDECFKSRLTITFEDKGNYNEVVRLNFSNVRKASEVCRPYALN